MKLWILRPADSLPAGDDPWVPWFDRAFGFVVLAETEADARALASNEAGDEERSGVNPWMNAEYSTCFELKPEGDPQVVMRDFAAA